MSDVGSVRIFAAIEPDAALAALIQGYKDQTRSLVGEQLYLADPPHLTVYLAAFRSVAAALESWPRIAARHDDLQVHLTGWHVFEADALTGNHTLVCNIGADDKARLRELQRDVIEQLAPQRDAPATRERLAPRLEFLTPDQRASVERCGFPYVGAGWEPHFTIASIRPDEWPKAWQVLAPRPPHGPFRCTGCRLYRLVDGKPVAIDLREDQA